ncbi:uncharacterized protein PHA67_006513 [Liasis olivaceus]
MKSPVQATVGLKTKLLLLPVSKRADSGTAPSGQMIRCQPGEVARAREEIQRRLWERESLHCKTPAEKKKSPARKEVPKIVLHSHQVLMRLKLGWILCSSTRLRREGLVSFEEVAVYFSEEERSQLDPHQEALHWEVMLENYTNVASLGFLLRPPWMFPRILPELNTDSG